MDDVSLSDLRGSSPDNDALSSRGFDLMVVRVRIRRAPGARLVAVAAAAPAAVDLYPLALARDAVAVAAADGRGGITEGR